MLKLPTIETPASCLSDLVLDEWHAGELEPARVAELARHVSGCERCAARRAELLAQAQAFLQAAPALLRATQPARAEQAQGFPTAVPAPAHLTQAAGAKPSAANGGGTTGLRRGPRLARTWLGAGVAGLAVAASLLLWVRAPADTGGTRSKGGARLGFFVKRGALVFAGMDQERVQPGDQLRFVVSTPRASHLAIFGLDARGVASVYHPTGGATRALGPGQQLALDEAVELDDTLGAERVYALFCEAPIDVQALRARLAATGELSRPAGCTLDVLHLVKERKP